MLIKGGRIIDPSQDIDEIGDLLIEGGKMRKIGCDLNFDVETIDARGCIVAPGFVDIHVHLREPGFSQKETIKTGTRAAANGGITTVVCMPNTNPTIHDPQVVQWVKETSNREAVVNVEVVGSITKNLEGLELSDIAGMVKEGIVAISDDGKTTMSEQLMKKAMETIKEYGIVLISHAEDHNLSKGGAMHLGKFSEQLSIPGIPSEAEWEIIKRDIQLAKTTGAKLHIAHISTKEGVELVKAAKQSGVLVSAEAAPHHFVLTDESVSREKTETKVNPPLRSEEDKNKVLEAVLDGSIEIIATDHAPHDEASKNTSYENAAFGMVGLETSLALSYTELVVKKGLSEMDWINRMATTPAQVLGLKKGTLKICSDADITIIDPNKEWVIDSKEFVSMGKNTPFNGVKVKGYARDVFVGGKIIKRDGELIC